MLISILNKNFKKLDIKLVINNDPELVIRSIKKKDIEILRNWKNQHKKFFFTKVAISSAQQKNWFQSYTLRTHDLMFIVSFKKENFGCMGIRWLKNNWDVYNVILGNKKYGRKGYMNQAFKIMISVAKELKIGRIKLDVLKNNPAIKWYKKQGFKVISCSGNYYTMRL